MVSDIEPPGDWRFSCATRTDKETNVNDEMKRLHYYSQDSRELMDAALGRDLVVRLEAQLPGADFRRMREGLAGLFYRGKNVGHAEGKRSAEAAGFQHLEEAARQEALERLRRALYEED